MEAEHQTIHETGQANLKDVLMKYLSYWKWFVLSAIVGLALGFVFLRYQIPVYEVNASILIKDDKKGVISDEMNAFEDLGILKSNRNIDNEIEILKSRSLMTLVVNELKLHIQYYSYGRPIEHERFFDSPFIASYLLSDSIKSVTGNWVIYPENERKFILKDGKTKSMIGNYNFGDGIDMPFGKLVITTTKFLRPSYLKKEFRIVINPVDAVVDRYIASVKINPVNKNANAIKISLRDALPMKAAAIVDNLIKQHNLDAIADKNQVSLNTYNFISERINYIAKELNEVEGTEEEYKIRNKLVDIKTDGVNFLETGSETEKGLLEVSTQKQIADYMIDYLAKHQDIATLIPSNLGITDIPLASQISEYNLLVLERSRLLKYSGEKNPVIGSLENQIISLRMAIAEGLKNYKNALVIRVNELSKKYNEINSKISSVPKNEREYRIIQRQQQIKEALYLYLLQKREETNIALAVTVANAKVIDYAYSDGKIVAPKKQIIYLVSLLLGLLFPALVLYLKDMMDTRVHSKSDIDQLKLPFIGDIPLTSSRKKVVISKGDNSSIAEALRLLRTNLDFVLGKNEGKGQTIFVTSTLGKEGKSFIALNLAASVAQSGKKVILIGMDFRAPKILKYLELEKKEGITNFISDKERNLDTFIFRAPGIDNLDILPSGSIPPNPAELLMNNRVQELFDKIKSEYDYVIVDTAPIGMVTDTLIISKYADAFLFVVRANVLEKRLLTIAENAYKEKRLPNMAVLLNGTDIKKGYGYGYGYGYGNEIEKKSWFKKIFSKKED
jgi:capsular exopolysaccharide synthesis family protein